MPSPARRPKYTKYCSTSPWFVRMRSSGMRGSSSGSGVCGVFVVESYGQAPVPVTVWLAHTLAA